MNNDVPDPLPPEWLPAPTASPTSDDAEVWEDRIGRLMAAAEPTLARYRVATLPRWGSARQRWNLVVGSALAAAASLAVSLGLGAPTPAAAPSNDLVLVAAVSESDPTLFRDAINAETDPVLGMITVVGEQP